MRKAQLEEQDAARHQCATLRNELREAHAELKDAKDRLVWRDVDKQLCARLEKERDEARGAYKDVKALVVMLDDEHRGARVSQIRRMFDDVDSGQWAKSHGERLHDAWRERDEVAYRLSMSEKSGSEIEFHARVNREALTDIRRRLGCSGNHGDILATLGVLIDARDGLAAALHEIWGRDESIQQIPARTAREALAKYAPTEGES